MFIKNHNWEQIQNIKTCKYVLILTFKILILMLRIVHMLLSVVMMREFIIHRLENNDLISFNIFLGAGYPAGDTLESLD